MFQRFTNPRTTKEFITFPFIYLLLFYYFLKSLSISPLSLISREPISSHPISLSLFLFLLFTFCSPTNQNPNPHLLLLVFSLFLLSLRSQLLNPADRRVHRPPEPATTTAPTAITSSAPNAAASTTAFASTTHPSLLRAHPTTDRRLPTPADGHCQPPPPSPRAANTKQPLSQRLLSLRHNSHLPSRQTRNPNSPRSTTHHFAKRPPRRVSSPPNIPHPQSTSRHHQPRLLLLVAAASLTAIVAVLQ